VDVVTRDIHKLLSLAAGDRRQIAFGALKGFLDVRYGIRDGSAW
jgi:hypothetical protein